MKRLALVTCILSVALLGAVGCDATEKAGNGATTDAEPAAGLPHQTGRAGLIPASRPPVSDLPVPMGFVLVEELSSDQLAGGERKVNHTYQGREEKYDVDRFYTNQMPLKRWTRTARQMDKGVITHRYTKGDQVCQLHITDAEHLFGRRTTVQVVIAPASDANRN